jgi:hypothetical protein
MNELILNWQQYGIVRDAYLILRHSESVYIDLTEYIRVVFEYGSIWVHRFKAGESTVYEEYSCFGDFVDAYVKD